MVSVQYGLPGLLPLGTEGKYDGQQMKYVENGDLLWLHLAYYIHTTLYYIQVQVEIWVTLAIN